MFQTHRSNFLPPFYSSPPFFLLQLNLSLPPQCQSTYFLSSSDLPPSPLLSPPHLLCTVTDPSGNCFESARHISVVAVYLCWGGEQGPEPQSLSAPRLEVKLPGSLASLHQKTLSLDKCDFTV